MYKVKCKECKRESRLNIKNGIVDYIDQMPIISARFRKDLKWGFECICGNDTRLCKEELFDEKSQVKVTGSSKDVVARVIDRMKQSSEDNFIMQEI